MTDSTDSDIQDIPIELTVSDMKHLLYGQRVFKLVGNRRVSIEYNEQEASDWCAQELRDLITEYRGDK